MMNLTTFEARMVAPAIARHLRHLAHSRGRLTAKFGPECDPAHVEAILAREKVLREVLTRIDKATH